MSNTTQNYTPNFIKSVQEYPDRPQNNVGIIGVPYGEKYFSTNILLFSREIPMTPAIRVARFSPNGNPYKSEAVRTHSDLYGLPKF